MTIAILAAVLGVLIAAASIGIPHLVRRRYQQPDDQDDSRAYLEATGQSAREIAEGNATLASQYKNDIRPQWLDR
jgi:hypothetical protein